MKERLQAGVWNAQVLLRELRESSYAGRVHDSDGLVAVRPFETPPGKQAQVDWSHLGSLCEQDDERALWGFTVILGNSQRMMAEAGSSERCCGCMKPRSTSGAQWRRRFSTTG